MIKLSIRIIFASLVIFTTLQAAQLTIAETYSFNDTLVYEGLGANGVSNIIFLDDSTYFFSTGYGLSVTKDGGESFFTYYNHPNAVKYGGVTSFTSLGSHLWVATAFDSIGVEESAATGNGISYSPDGGITWFQYPQMVDHPDSNYVLLYGDTIRALPTTVPIDNLTYDMSVHINSTGDTLLWATSFAGGTRVSRDLGRTWKRVVLPADNMDFLDEQSDLNFNLSPVDRPDLNLTGNYNHRAFSVIAQNDLVVVGTAGGVNISINSGRTWRKYTALNSGLSGNFIVALHIGPDGTIYAAALPAVGAGEFQSLSFTTSGFGGALYWENTLNNKRLYNISTAGSRIYAASKTGIWVSGDKWNWVPMSYPKDRITGDQLYSDEVYVVDTDPFGRLWAGTGDGLAYTEDDGYNWKIIRRVKSLGLSSELKISAYPNPFSPGRMNFFDGEGHVRFHVAIPENGTLSLDVFDFGMNRVKRVAEAVSVTAGEQDFIWNGKNGLNDMVSNGTYFVRGIFKGNNRESMAWTKIIILE
ncbi:MAG TPA: hypothetical protein ENO01_02705 [Candidatus Marinimicrobia bacterium]|nr:hypothetical protein [Candidatus Neomarinimicrobiota bacterium]